MKSHIRSLRARQILDSRGRPTIEVDVELQDGSLGRAAVPSGASTGAAEAHELRDGDPAVHAGLGVRRAVDHVNTELARALAGFDAADQEGADHLLRATDGTPDLSRLGANAILGVSLALCRAFAITSGQALHARIAELSGNPQAMMPMPMVNILSGGLHASRGMDVQDFLAVPVAARSIEEAIRHVAQVRASAATLMAQRGLPTLLADEGGLSPGFRTGRKALQFMVEAFEHAGFRPGLDMGIAIDVAASTLHAPDGRYDLAREGRVATAQEMIALFDEWVRDFPICSIEDGLDEEAWSDWQMLTEQLGSRVQLVGDDLFTTNAARLEKGIAARIGNGVLVKLNQNGTLTGTLDVIARARRAGYAAIVSARSGETEDPFIADLAVGCATGHIKIGSVRCSDRLAKYNQLLRIEEHTGAPFAGMSQYRAWQGNAS